MCTSHSNLLGSVPDPAHASHHAKQCPVLQRTRMMEQDACRQSDSRIAPLKNGHVWTVGELLVNHQAIPQLSKHVRFMVLSCTAYLCGCLQLPQQQKFPLCRHHLLYWRLPSPLLAHQSPWPPLSTLHISIIPAERRTRDTCPDRKAHRGWMTSARFAGLAAQHIPASSGNAASFPAPS